MASETKNSELQVACCLPMPSADIPDLPSQNLKPTVKDSKELSLAIGKQWFWDNGTSINVRFLNRYPDLEDAVRKAAKVWETYANVHFLFDNSSDAQVRIWFDENLPGGRSMLGKFGHEQTLQDQETATMTLGARLTLKVFERTALHELGHVLGCIHEHCSPVANIDWNRCTVIKWYMDSDAKYNAEWVEKNIFQKYSSDDFQTTLFDKKSIMIYPIFPGWAKNVKMVDWPEELSPADKMLIGRVYPPIMSTESVTYHTRETRHWSEPEHDNIKKVKFTNPLKKDLELAIGITHFDLKAEKNMHFAAYANSWNPTESTFNLHLNSKKGTTMFSAGVTCMLTEKYNPRLRMGSYTTRPADLKRGLGENKEFQARIEFEKPFEDVPHVVVWLQAFDFEFQKGTLYAVKAYAINAYAENGDCNGFTIHVDALQGARLKSAVVSWVAYEKDPPGIMSGRLDFENFMKSESDNSNLPEKHCFKSKNLGEWQLTRLYAGVSKFNFDSRWNLRIAVKGDCQDSSFDIDAYTWANSSCNGIVVSYIAIIHSGKAKPSFVVSAEISIEEIPKYYQRYSII